MLRQERYESSHDLVILIGTVCVILHNILVRMRVSGKLPDEVGDRRRAISIEHFVADFHDSEQTAGIATEVHEDTPGAPATGLADLLTPDEEVLSRVL